MTTGASRESGGLEVLCGITKKADGGPAVARQQCRLTVEPDCVTIDPISNPAQAVVTGAMVGGVVGGGLGVLIHGAARRIGTPIRLNGEGLEIRYDDKRRIVSLTQSDGIYLVIKPHFHHPLGTVSEADFQRLLSLLQRVQGAKTSPAKLSRVGWMVYLLIALLILWPIVMWLIFTKRIKF